MTVLNLKIVLVSETDYRPSHDPFLVSLLNRGARLFCVVGKDCMAWEDAIDALCESGNESWLDVVTTCHPDASIEDVIEFANTLPGAGVVECVTV